MTSAGARSLVSGYTNRYALYRQVGATCSSAGTKIADYLTSTNGSPPLVFPAFAHAAGCGCLASLQVDFAVSVKGTAVGAYELTDTIFLTKQHEDLMTLTDRLTNRLRRAFGDERGFALVIALGVTVVLSMTVVTVIESATSNQRSSTMTGGRSAAYNLAEAGLNNAMSILRLPTNNALDKYVFCADAASLPTLPCTRTDTYSAGTVVWYGNLYQNPAAGTAYWDLFSTGHVRNPFGGADYQKTIRATIPVVPITTQPLNNPSWNYIFSRATGTGVAFSGCDMTLANSVNVTAPLYVMGNLCLQNTAKISKGPLIVKGSMDLQANGNQVGAAGADINEAHIGKGCRYRAQASAQPLRLRRGQHDARAGQRLGDDPRRDPARRHCAGRRLEQLVSQREPRPVLPLRGSAGGRSGQPGVCLRQPRRRG